LTDEQAAKLPPFDEAKFNASKNTLVQQSRKLHEQIDAMNTRRGLVLSNVDSCVEQKSEVDLNLEQFWTEVKDLQAHILTRITQIHASKKSLQYLDDELKFLEHSTFNDTFELSWDGNLASINGFRLGKLPTIPVSRQEINSAFGCIAHMLEVIAAHLRYEFKHCKPICRGSFSKVRVFKTSSSNESDFELFLHGKSDIPKQFDHAIVCLLTCLRELESKLPAPYQYKVSVSNATVGGYSAKLTGNDDVLWSKCLKYLMINLKQLASLMKE